MADERLESWKEIAVYLKRDESTVRRWERSEGLPVHRHQHQARSSVYAFPAELDAWREVRRGPGAGIRVDRPSMAGTIAAALAVIVLSSGGRFAGPAMAGAQENGVTARLEWSGRVYNYAQVTRDGRYLSITSGETGDLAVVGLATGTTRNLTNGGGFEHGLVEFSVPSPGGQRFAYSWYEPKSKKYELRLVGLDGGEPVVLVRNSEIEYLQPFDWSIDGSRIVMAIQRGGVSQIALVGVPGGQMTVLKSGGWFPPSAAAFSADGRSIAYKGSEGVNVIAADGRREEGLVTGTSVTGMLGWVSDGSGVLVTGNLKGRPGIWMVPVRDGRTAGEPSLVRQLDGRISGLGVESNGNVHYLLSTGGNSIYLADFDAGAATVVGTPTSLGSTALGGRDPAWSPDGKELAFIQPSMQRGPSVGSLAIYSPANGQMRQLPLRLTYPRYPTWLPAGRAMLVHGRDDKGREALFRIELASGEVTRLFDAANNPPVISRDGSRVFAKREISETESVIVAVNLANGREEVALDESAIQFQLSPDNTAWIVQPTKPCCPAPLMLRTGGSQKQVTLPEDLRPRLRGGWTPDGRRLLIVGRGRGSNQLVSIGLADGDARVAGGRFANINGVSLHSDGTRVAISAAESTAGPEVWVLSGLGGHRADK
jgi:Tol biopolymer transport system component